MHARTPILIAALAAMALGGCFDRTAARSEAPSEVAATKERVGSEIVGAKVQVDATTDSVTNLMQADEEATLPKRYQLFVQSLEELKAQRELLSERADDMLERRDAYLDEWRTQVEGIQNSELRHSSRQRMDQLSKQFSDVRQQLVEAEYAMKPMIDTLEDLKSSLEYDLTLLNLKQVQKSIDPGSLNQEEIRRALTQAQIQLADLDQVAVLR